MQYDIERMVRKLADLDNTKQLSPEQAYDFADIIVGRVILEVRKKIQNVIDNFDFSIYDHPYFADVPTAVAAEDFVTLLIDEIESLNG